MNTVTIYVEEYNILRDRSIALISLTEGAMVGFYSSHVGTGRYINVLHANDVVKELLEENDRLRQECGRMVAGKVELKYNPKRKWWKLFGIVPIFLLLASCTKQDPRCWECDIKHLIYEKTETYCQEEKPVFDDPYIISVNCKRK